MATWIPGGAADPAYALRYVEWGYGSAVCLGIAFVASVVLRDQWRWRTVSIPAHREDVFTAIVACGALGVYVVVARGVFDGRPIDD